MAWGRRILTLQGCPTIVLVMYTWQAFQPPPPRSARWCRDLKCCCCCCCCWSSQLHVSARSRCLSTCPGLHPSHCAKCSKSHPPHSLLSGKVARFWQKHVFKQHVNNLMAQSSWNLHQRIEPAESLQLNWILWKKHDSYDWPRSSPCTIQTALACSRIESLRSNW